MTERVEGEPRRIGMKRAVVMVPLFLTVVTGCGTVAEEHPAAHSPSSSPSRSICAGMMGAATAEVAADLDGDGRAEIVQYLRPAAGDACVADQALLVSTLPDASLEVSAEPPLGRGDLRALRLPGRTGEVVLSLQQHPRGGFQARLYGYAEGELEELTIDGRAVFPFVATDVETTPLSARCTSGGFEVTEAKVHDPVGIVASWDVVRTAYRVDGNALSAAASVEIADNVPDQDLATRYPDLVKHRLFSNCLVGG